MCKSVFRLIGLGAAVVVLALALGVGQGTGIEDFETCDFSRFPWQFGGDASWTITRSEPHTGSCAAQAGRIGDDERTYMEVRLAVSGAITFWYRVWSESCCDLLNFYIDNQLRGSWPKIEEVNEAGDTGWRLAGPIPVSPGIHTFRWEYEKDSGVSKGQDTAWIDNITFGTVGVPAVVFVWDNIFADGNPNNRGKAFAQFVSFHFPVIPGLPTFTANCALLNFDFINLTGSAQLGLGLVLEGFYGAGNIRQTWAIPPANLRVLPNAPTIVEWEFMDSMGRPTPLPSGQSAHVGFQVCSSGAMEGFESGDFSFLPWESRGDDPWVVIRNEARSGLYAARAGSIGNGGFTSLEVKQATSGNISFWYKVSSESCCDKLIFSIFTADSEEKINEWSWSGETGWQQFSTTLSRGPGVYLFRWEYVKDGSASSGQDTAWIDDISFGAALVEVKFLCITWLPAESCGLPMAGIQAYDEKLELVNALDEPIRIGEVRMARVDQALPLETLNENDLPNQLRQQGEKLQPVHSGGVLNPGQALPPILAPIFQPRSGPSIIDVTYDYGTYEGYILAINFHIQFLDPDGNVKTLIFYWPNGTTAAHLAKSELDVSSQAGGKRAELSP